MGTILRAAKKQHEGIEGKGVGKFTDKRFYSTIATTFFYTTTIINITAVTILFIVKTVVEKIVHVNSVKIINKINK